MNESKWGTVEGPGECRSCKAPMWWVLTRKGKKMPVNEDDTCHWETCPQAKEWRRERTSPPPGSEKPATTEPIDPGNGVVCRSKGGFLLLQIPSDDEGRYQHGATIRLIFDKETDGLPF